MGHFHRVQSFRICSAGSLWGHRSCQEPAPAWASHRVTASSMGAPCSVGCRWISAPPWKKTQLFTDSQRCWSEGMGLEQDSHQVLGQGSCGFGYVSFETLQGGGYPVLLKSVSAPASWEEVFPMPDMNIPNCIPGFCLCSTTWTCQAELGFVILVLATQITVIHSTCIRCSSPPAFPD